jgi:hypothetical protein
MGVILKNNATSTITTAISASDVGLAVAAGTGSLFPTLGTGNYFYATLVSSGGTYEVIKVTARVGDTMTIVRAQEGTTAQSFASGSRFELRVTAASITDLIPDTILVKNYGAVGDGVTNDTAAIQAAIDYAHGLSNGGQVWFDGTFAVDDTLTIGKNVHLCGVATIKQTTNNKPIIKVNKDLYNNRWSITDLTLEYATQQTVSDTDARGLVLCETNKFSYLFSVKNVRVLKGYKGIDAPEETGSFAFLGTFDNVEINQCVDWGFDWRNAATGATTFLSMNNVWVNNTAGAEIAGSKGFRIQRCESLCINSLAVDHIQSQPIQIGSCVGNIGVVSIESCDRSASSGGIYLCEVNGGSINFGEVNLTANNTTISGSAFAAGLRVSDSAWVDVGILRDNLNTVVDTSSDAFYTVSPTSNVTAYIKDYVYVAAGSNPVPNGSLAEFSQPYRIRMFDNNVRTDVRGGKTHIFDTAAPVSGTWAVGDIVWNTTPTAGGFIGWTCTTAGTPGTWKTFGAVSA